LSASKLPAESREFISEVQSEFKKVTWPTEKETLAGTMSVLVIVTVVGLALWAIDLTLSAILTRFLA